MADNKDIVMRYYNEVWAKGDPGPLGELLADDYVDHNPVPGVPADKAGATQIECLRDRRAMSPLIAQTPSAGLHAVGAAVKGS